MLQTVKTVGIVYHRSPRFKPWAKRFNQEERMVSTIFFYMLQTVKTVWDYVLS
jgi:hypothetical protein